MKAESELLFRRGKRGTLYLRRRIPSHLRDAYPPNRQNSSKACARATSMSRRSACVLSSLVWTNSSSACESSSASAGRHPSCSTSRICQSSSCKTSRKAGYVLFSRPTTKCGGKVWTTMIFRPLGERIAEQRSELGQLLARGQIHRILPAMRTTSIRRVRST